VTGKQALAEAQKRWGKTAMVEKRQGRQWALPYAVGRVALGMFFEIKGQGTTWEEAFSEATAANERLLKGGRVKTEWNRTKGVR
jgi:hypothetical protein